MLPFDYVPDAAELFDVRHSRVFEFDYRTHPPHLRPTSPIAHANSKHTNAEMEFRICVTTNPKSEKK